MLQDVRQALRSLAKRPSSAILTVIVFAVAIGANTTVFSVFNSYFLRPLPFPDERLVMVYDSAPKAGIEDAGNSVGSYLGWRTAQSLEAAAIYTQSDRTLQGERAERISVTRASPSLSAVLGVSPALGRGFNEDEAIPGNDLVILLSHALWVTHFGASSDVLGQELRLDDSLYRVVGVMPEGFGFPDRDTDAWLPFAHTFGEEADAGDGYVEGVARLRPDATVEQLNAEFDAIAPSNYERLAAPAAFLKEAGYTIRGQPLRDYVNGDLRQRLLLLQGLVFAVLLIACINVANLQVARLTARRKELAVRAALGAGTHRLARLLVLESVLLGLAGACGGLLFAYGGINLVRVLNLERLTDGADVALDASVLTITFGAALSASMLSALLPLLALLREDLARGVHESGRGNSGGIAMQRWRSGLVVVQLAFGVALLVSAGLLTKSFYELQRRGPGFDPDGVWSASVELPKGRYEDDETRTRFFEQALAELRSLPNVVAVGFATTLPFAGTDSAASLVVDGYQPLDGSPPQVAQLHSIDEGYFATLGIPVVRGRNFALREAERVVVVDESFARAYWPEGNAIGQRLRGAGMSDEWYTVIGVVPHVKHDSFTGDEFEHTVYWHFGQRPAAGGMIVLRADVPGESMTSAAQAAIARIDTTVALADIVPMQTRVRDALGPQRTPMVLTMTFAGIAVVLAIIGVYGVLAWVVARRVVEIGVRMALGAQSSDVLRMVMRQGLRMVTAGVLLGIAGALAFGRVMAASIPEVPAADPIVLAVSVLALTGAAMFASWLPARRASCVDPIEALRRD